MYVCTYVCMKGTVRLTRHTSYTLDWKDVPANVDSLNEPESVLHIQPWNRIGSLRIYPSGPFEDSVNLKNLFLNLITSLK